jgi:porin
VTWIAVKGPLSLPAVALATAALLAPVLARSEDGVNSGMTARGAHFSATYAGESVSNVSGGVKPGTVYLGNLQAQLTLDLGLQTTFFADVMLLHGGQPDEFVGDAQGVSNMTGPPGPRLEEAWLQRTFDEGRLSLLAGRYDLNSEFYRLQAATLFLNSSFGIGPEFSQSGPAGPSVFPSTAAAVRVDFKPVRGVVLRAAVLAGRPFQATSQNAQTVGGDGLLAIAEAAYLERPGPPEPRNRRLRVGRLSNLPPYEDKLAFGAWHYTATFQDLSATGSNGEPVQHRGSSGGYLLVDRMLTRPDAHGPHAAAFLQLGIGDDRVNRFGSYIGTGISISSFSQHRSNDEIGIALASARNGGHYLAEQQMIGTPALRNETTFEVTYLAQIGSLAVQPDLQYVVHPNTDPTRRNALAFLLRVQYSFD